MMQMESTIPNRRKSPDAVMLYRRHLQKLLYVQTCRNYVAQKNVRVHEEETK